MSYRLAHTIRPVRILYIDWDFMTHEQILAFAVIAAMMGVFIWDRFRYDVVACCALVGAVGLGVVPVQDAFSGFSDDIVIIVASALVVSAGVARSGIVDMAIKKFFPNLGSLRGQLALLMIVVAVLSAFIKNIGALAIMMPVAFQFSRRGGGDVPICVISPPRRAANAIGIRYFEGETRTLWCRGCAKR